MIKTKNLSKSIISYVIKGGKLMIAASVILAAVSCSSSTETPQSSTLVTLPGLRVTPYVFSIHFPDGKNETSLRAEPGDTIPLPVTVRSIIHIPMSIQLVQGDDTSDVIIISGNNDYITLQPTENVTISVTCVIAENAAPGLYQAEIRGKLKVPVSGWYEGGTTFKVYINAKS